MGQGRNVTLLGVPSLKRTTMLSTKNHGVLEAFAETLSDFELKHHLENGSHLNASHYLEIEHLNFLMNNLQTAQSGLPEGKVMVGVPLRK